MHITNVNLVLALSFGDPIVLMRNGDVREVMRKITGRLKLKFKKLRQKSKDEHQPV